MVCAEKGLGGEGVPGLQRERYVRRYCNNVVLCLRRHFIGYIRYCALDDDGLVTGTKDARYCVALSKVRQEPG
jgi:hypothetical protein